MSITQIVHYQRLLSRATGKGKVTVELLPREKISAALQAVVELHKPIPSETEDGQWCEVCSKYWPCEEMKIVERELE